MIASLTQRALGVGSYEYSRAVARPIKQVLEAIAHYLVSEN